MKKYKIYIWKHTFRPHINHQIWPKLYTTFGESKEVSITDRNRMPFPEPPPPQKTDILKRAYVFS